MMIGSEIEIKSIQKNDKLINNIINDVVNVHLNAFPNFFLSTLGFDFLKTYYESFVKHDNGNLIIAIRNGKVVAFAAASSICQGFNTSLLTSNFFRFGLCFLKLIFINPMSIIRLTKNLKKKSSEVNHKEDYAELYSIGTLVEIQGKGIGTHLLNCMEQQLKEKGVNKLSLTTDYFNNEKTVGFYNKNGFDILYEFVSYPNRRMYRLIKQL